MAKYIVLYEDENELDEVVYSSLDEIKKAYSDVYEQEELKDWTLYDIPKEVGYYDTDIDTFTDEEINEFVKEEMFPYWQKSGEMYRFIEYWKEEEPQEEIDRINSANYFGTWEEVPEEDRDWLIDAFWESYVTETRKSFFPYYPYHKIYELNEETNKLTYVDNFQKNGIYSHFSFIRSLDVIRLNSHLRALVKIGKNFFSKSS